MKCVVLFSPFQSELAKDHRSEIEGYHGLYNFIHHFWATDGSRLYPPIPHIGLNIHQDLAADFGQFQFDSSRLQLLLKLLKKPRTASSERILRAIDWFNVANSVTANEEESIVSLAVGFETLLGLPEGDKKTERLVDSVALLLGRIPRLESWVRQFYRARSEIVHEGQTGNLRFVASASTKRPDGPLYHSLLNYGRQVFQLCVGALLFGATLAEKAGLEEKLVTNQERFEEVSKELSDESVPPADRLRKISLKVQQAENYRFVSESSFNIDKILHSVRSASESLLACDHGLEAGVKDCLGRIVSAGRRDRYSILDGLRELDGLIARSDAPHEVDEPREVAYRLFRLAWACTFMNYFWLKEESESKAEPEPEPGQ